MISENSNANGIEKKNKNFVCPFCNAFYQFSKAEISNSYPKCDQCGILLLPFKERSGNKMKCLACILAIEVPEGLWCIKFRGLASEEMAATCSDFLSRDILGDVHEG
jgi:hypothetical protein